MVKKGIYLVGPTLKWMLESTSLRKIVCEEDGKRVIRMTYVEVTKKNQGDEMGPCGDEKCYI